MKASYRGNIMCLFKAAGHQTHTLNLCFIIHDRGTLVQEGSTQAVYYNLIGLFDAWSSCTEISTGPEHAKSPCRSHLGRVSAALYSYSKYLWFSSTCASSRWGYLLLEERTWCLIQLVGERDCPGCLGLLALLPKEDWKLWMVS